MPFAAWLLLMIGPLVKKALVALGVGVISYAALTVAFGAVRDAVVANYSTIGGPVAQLIDLIGIGQALGIILGGIAARVSLMALSRFGKL